MYIGNAAEKSAAFVMLILKQLQVAKKNFEIGGKSLKVNFQILN